MEAIGGFIAFLVVVAGIVYIAKNPEKVKEKLGLGSGGTKSGDGKGGSGSNTTGRRYHK